MPTPETEVYATIGEQGFTRLVAAFYRQIPNDDVLGPLYPRDDLHGAEERLRLFLIQRFGGPTTYTENRGHPRLRMRHAPFQVDFKARDRWLQLMERALTEANLPEETHPTLRKYFLDTATFMVNHPPGEGPGRLGLRA